MESTRTAQPGRLTAAASALAIGLSVLVFAAPPAQARGFADCFSASGSLSYDGKSYSLRINNNCFPVGSGEEGFGARVGYDFSMGLGGYCASSNGTLSVSSLGNSVTVSTSCLRPGSYRPQVSFSSFQDGSRNTEYLSTVYISEPKPEPTFTRPSPTPTPTPSLRPITPTVPTRPDPTPTLTVPGAAASAPMELRTLTTTRRAEVVRASLTPAGAMRAVIQTQIPKGKRATIEVTTEDPQTSQYVTRERKVKVRKGGLLRVRADLGRYSFVDVFDNKGRLLVSWSTL